MAVALGIGRLLPALLQDQSTTPFVLLGVGYAILALFLVAFGAVRERTQARALGEGRFAPLPGWVVVATTA